MRPLDLDTVDHLLSTTRAVRKRLDLSRPVEPEVIEECLRLAIQAPTGSNSQGWRWIVVTDAEKRAALAEIYRKGFYPYREAQTAAVRTAGAQEAAAQETKIDDQMLRVADSADYLAEHFHEVPVHVIPCIGGRGLAGAGNVGAAGIYGSIFPAVWSFQLALRSRGLASSLTTLHLVHEAEAAELLGIPDDYLQVALLPVAYFTGEDFKPAKRKPVEWLTSWNTWKGTR
ncbi:MAG: nitroreductase family protein [Acidimicrobiia bacterium]|nr:nitroreductase family protein [Acidimicrobiia bacterium]